MKGKCSLKVVKVRKSFHEQLPIVYKIVQTRDFQNALVLFYSKTVFMPHTRNVTPGLNSGAMADIAFLLLTFYMVTTEIKEYKGLSLLLPPHTPAPIVALKGDRNVFTIHINLQDRLLIEGEERKSMDVVRKEIKRFVLNYKKDPVLSDSPEDAVVSIKTDRGTTYKAFIAALDEAQAAYYEIYAERIGLTPDQFRKLNLNIRADRELYQRARRGMPMSISIAEPTGQ